VCLTCHQAVEAIDKGYHLKYLSLKKQVEAEYEPRALGEERPKTLQGALF
jgi:hypothetical protein